MGMNSFAHMVQEYYVQRLRERFGIRKERLASLRTRQDAEGYVAEVAALAPGIFSPFPPRCPLNAQVTGRLELDGVRVEKITFVSRPGCLVTANLYLPAKLEAPAPGVLVPCGHSANGKANSGYQAACMRLALHGFVALIYDPFHQGERDQYVHLRDQEAVAGPTTGHNMMGKQLELVGEWFGTWRTWDGMRAADLLGERPEVDSSRLGITGNSGGGTLTTWLWACDDRFTMAAPSCFTTTILANLENELPADAEQYPHGLIGAGLERTDLLIGRAPKPLLVLGQEYDFFDRRGLREAYEELRHIYTLLGAEDSLGFFADTKGHGFSAANQIAMIEFFCRHSGMPWEGAIEPPDPRPDIDLLATPEGSDIKAGARSIHVHIHDRAIELAASRPAVKGEKLPAIFAKLANLPAGGGAVPHHRVLRAVRLADRVVGRYAIETEPGILALVKHPVSDPNHALVLEPGPEVTVYVPHLSSEEDLEQEPWAAELLERDLYAIDVRGLGESMPNVHPDERFMSYAGMDYMYHGTGLMLGESYLGRRVHDLLQSVRVLRAAGAEQIHLYGRGQGSLIALFAAVMSRDFASVHLQHTPRSFLEWTEAPVVTWPAANFPRGILSVADLADFHHLLGESLHLYETWDARMMAWSAGDAQPEPAGLTRADA